MWGTALSTKSVWILSDYWDHLVISDRNKCCAGEIRASSHPCTWQQMEGGKKPNVSYSTHWINEAPVIIFRWFASTQTSIIVSLSHSVEENNTHAWLYSNWDHRRWSQKVLVHIGRWCWFIFYNSRPNRGLLTLAKLQVHVNAFAQRCF